MGQTKESSTLKIGSRQWHIHLADVINARETAEFPQTLVKALRHVVPFDYSVWFVYRQENRPICVHDTFTRKQRVVFVKDYQEGPYLLDPFFKLCADGHEPGLYRLREIAPDRFYHSEYYRSYYRRTGLAEEIAFMVELSIGVRLILSLMRAGDGSPFSDRDMAKLQRIEPVVRAITARQWKSIADLHDHYLDPTARKPAVRSQVSTAFENFGKEKLTPRECEIVRMVLRGHSSESIGRQCGITTGTVKIHRKNIYAKLNISTQSELFSLFISEL